MTFISYTIIICAHILLLDFQWFLANDVVVYTKLHIRTVSKEVVTKMFVYYTIICENIYVMCIFYLDYYFQMGIEIEA